MDAAALKAMEQVKKLLALAGNNDNEHQAAAALAKANEIMERYNLDIATVGQERAETSSRADNKRKGGLYAWQRDLWESVAKLNFCMYWSIKGLQRGQTYEHRLLGRQINVISTEIMAEYLQKTIERLAKEYAKKYGHNVFAREMIGFREGMQLRICERLRALRMEREEAEKKARAEAKAREAARVAEYERRLREDPEFAAEVEATKKRNEEWWTNYQKERAEKAAKEEKLRAKRAGKPGYDEWGYKINNRQYRERAKTEREKRAETYEFRDGYNKGGTVSLNQQVDTEERKAIDG